MLGLHPKIQTCHSPCKTTPSGSPGPHPCAEEAPQPLCGPEEVPWRRHHLQHLWGGTMHRVRPVPTRLPVHSWAVS